MVSGVWCMVGFVVRKVEIFFLSLFLASAAVTPKMAFGSCSQAIFVRPFSPPPHVNKIFTKVQNPMTNDDQPY